MTVFERLVTVRATARARVVAQESQRGHTTRHAPHHQQWNMCTSGMGAWTRHCSDTPTVEHRGGRPTETRARISEGCRHEQSKHAKAECGKPGLVLALCRVKSNGISGRSPRYEAESAGRKVPNRTAAKGWGPAVEADLPYCADGQGGGWVSGARVPRGFEN